MPIKRRQLKKTLKKNGILFRLRKNTWLGQIDTGWGNGYVSVNRRHSLYQTHYDDTYNIIMVHGGLTYSEQGPKNTWVFGFDTAHYSDTLQTWPKVKVLKETLRLAKQLLRAKDE